MSIVNGVYEIIHASLEFFRKKTVINQNDHYLIVFHLD